MTDQLTNREISGAQILAKPKPTPPAEPKLETIPLDDLVPDPANLRVHGPKNRKAVTGSVRRFGPWRSVAIDQGNVIYAGNETARAAKEAGFTEVLKVTPKPGQLVAVCREDLTETEKTAYGIADNQTGLIDDAIWAPELPAAISSLELDEFELECLGFDEGEIKSLLGHPENGAIEDGDWPAHGEPDSHSVVVRYRDEDVPALLKFIGEADEKILAEGRAGSKILGRIRQVAEG